MQMRTERARVLYIHNLVLRKFAEEDVFCSLRAAKLHPWLLRIRQSALKNLKMFHFSYPQQSYARMATLKTEIHELGFATFRLRTMSNMILSCSQSAWALTRSDFKRCAMKLTAYKGHKSPKRRGREQLQQYVNHNPVESYWRRNKAKQY